MKTKGADPNSRKRVIRSFFNLVMQGRQKEGLRFFAPNCRQHNPYVKGGMDMLFDAMTAVQNQPTKYPDPQFAVKKVMAEGDMVAVYSELLNSRSRPSEGGLRQVHLFRFGRGNKVVEYWDITQMVQPDMPNAANAF